MKKNKFILLICFLLFLGNTHAASFTIEAEDMTLEGKYAGTISSPFNGIALYTNGDKGTVTSPFPDGAGIYEVSITGASSKSSAAGVSLYLNDEKVKAFSFTGTDPSTATVDMKLPSIGTSVKVALILETDNGSNDTFIDKITFSFKGAIVVKDPPVLPEKGAYYTGTYRNMFVEAGYGEVQINQKLEELWSKFFYGDAGTQALYYPVGTDEAYMLDTGNEDVRSEGMSYGMMLCLQMDKKAEFDRLWKWAKTHMQYTSGQYEGYFAWQMNTNGSIKGNGPASDGEEYFIMSLMFASNRWGDGEGIYNYKKEANDLLAHCMKRGDTGGGVTNLFNSTQKQVTFVPYGNSATFTDPSYHLPAFYELWSRWATDKSKRTFWKDCAAKSREMFPKFADSQTGLMPDYAEFNGSPRNEGDHKYFCYDAWRCIMNVAVDYAWFKADENEAALVNRIHNFFNGKGIESYGGLYKLDGTVLNNNTDHSPGLIACNATGALASNQSVAWDFIDDFFNKTIPSGKYRYYDGLLYFMNYLHLSGNFKIYSPEGEDPEDPEDPENPGTTTPDGYYIIDDFEIYPLDQQLYVDGTKVTATVKANPTVPNEKSANIIVKSYSTYCKFAVTLPDGKTLADYEKLFFDFYLPSGYGNEYKSAYAAISSTQLSPVPSGNMPLNTWITKECALPAAVSSLSSFDLYLGFNANNGNFYIDNVKLKGKPEQANKIETPETNSFYYSGSTLYLGDMSVDNISVFDVNGRLLISKDNVSSSVDISGLQSGVYVVRISTNGQIRNMKIVK